MRTIGLALLALSAGLGGSASAQEPAGPPKVLVVTREEIKPGKMGPHTKQAGAYVSVANRANAANYRLGLIPISGDENVVVYLEAQPSFEAFETARNAFDSALASNAALKADMDAVDRQGDLHNAQRTAICRYRAELSYRPGRMEDVARARYVTIVTTHVKPGRGVDYVEYMKGQVAAREKANLDAHTAVFQVVSGAAPNTFMSFTAFRSLKDWDDVAARAEADQKAMEAALGGADAARQQRLILADVVVDAMVATYAMSPDISRPAPPFMAYDAAFWGARTTADGKARPAKKEEHKPQPKQ